MSRSFVALVSSLTVALIVLLMPGCTHFPTPFYHLEITNEKSAESEKRDKESKDSEESAL
jgi:hypothetical protein